MICQVNGVEQSWMRAPFAVLMGTLQGRRVVVYRRGANADASWSKWAIIAASIVLLLPINLIRLTNYLLKIVRTGLVESNFQTPPVVAVQISPELSSEAPVKIDLKKQFSFLFPVVRTLHEQLSSDKLKGLMEAPNPCTQILNHHEQPFTKKVGGQVVVKIFSFLGFKEACVLSTTSPEFAVYLHQRIQKEMEVSELVVKSFFHLSLSIKHRLSIKSSYWIYQEVFLSEDRKWRELFQKFNISYPESCIRTTEHFKEKRHIVYSHTRDYIDNFIEYCNGRETKNLTIDEEILYNGYLNRGIIPIIDFSDQTGVKIVSRFGTIGFAFHCQFYNIKSKHDLHSGMLVFCLSNTRSRSQCEVYIIENYKNTILFRENSVIFYLLILSKAEQNFTKLGCEQAKSGFGSFYVKLGTAPPLSKR